MDIFNLSDTERTTLLETPDEELGKYSFDIFCWDRAAPKKRENLTLLPSSFINEDLLEVIDMRECKVDGCDNRVCAKGFCEAHYAQLRRNGKITKKIVKRKPRKGPDKICSVPWCDSKFYAKGFCYRHWFQNYRDGFVYKSTKYDGNEIEDFKDFAKMIFSNKGKVVGEMIFDVEDIKKARKHNWYINSYGYVVCHDPLDHKHRINFANFVLGDFSKIIDHRNRNTLDNRKTNLRPCLKDENAKNRKLNANNTTGFKGVYLIKNGKFDSYIRSDKKVIYLGRFNNAVDASIAYDNASKHYHGEFASPNEAL